MEKTREDHVNLIIKMVEENNRVPPEKIDALQEDDLDELKAASDSLLISLARQAKEEGAFAPYSEYPVGAALLTDKGVFLGANIEISGRSTSVHAEMLAAYKAVFEAATEFHTMAVTAGEDPSGDIAPCGLCQHTLSQFTDELRVIEDAGDDDPKEYWLSELIGDGYSASTRHFDKVSDTS